MQTEREFDPNPKDLLKRAYIDGEREYADFLDCIGKALYRLDNALRYRNSATTLEEYDLVYDGPERSALPSVRELEATRGQLQDFVADFVVKEKGRPAVVIEAKDPARRRREMRSGGYSGHSKFGRGAYETAYEAFQFNAGKVFSLAELQDEMLRLGWTTKAVDPQGSVRTTVKRLVDQGHISRVATGRYARIDDPLESSTSSEGGGDTYPHGQTESPQN